MVTKMGKYLCTFSPNHPRATKEGYVYTHVLVAEKMLGRFLTAEECVHHKDGEKYNNTEDNLMVFKTINDHSAFHKGVEAVKDGDVWWCPNKKHTVICPICGETKGKYAKTCPSCKKIMRMRQTIDERIRKVKQTNTLLTDDHFRTQLKNDIRKCSFTNVGKIYGVTDNCVRKWCDKYNLPRHTAIIKLIPEDEWQSEILSEETKNLINEYYISKHHSDQEIVDFYLHTPNLTITVNKFHSDFPTIRKILHQNNIRILSANASRNLHPVEQYENGVVVNTFLNSTDAAQWLISNNISTSTLKNISFRILQACANECTYLKYGWKFNEQIDFEQFLRLEG